MTEPRLPGPDQSTDQPVIVVGAGPAGLSVAQTLAEHGESVIVIDAGHQPGGQYWRHPDEDLASGEVPPKPAGQHDWAVFQQLSQALRKHRASGRIRYLPATQVWMISPAAKGGFRLELRPTMPIAATESSPSRLLGQRLVLCPGAHDRQLPIPGWDLPGVMAAGGVQAMLKAQGITAGRRVVVAGTGPFLLPVATGLAAAGAKVTVCEAHRPTGWLRHLPQAVRVPAKLTEAVQYTALMARHKISYRTRSIVGEIRGTDQVQSVRIDRVDAAGAVTRRGIAEVAADLVALGWGFSPSMELLIMIGADTRLDHDGSLIAAVDEGQRTSVPGVYVAGEACGVGGAALAVAEGRLAGLSLLNDSGHAVWVGGDLHRLIRRHRAFAQALQETHPVPDRWLDWCDPQTLVCRCEEVEVQAVRSACTELGAVDARSVKSFTRAGMGWCQGRICGFAAAHATARLNGRDITTADLAALAKRSLAVPVSLGELAELEEPGPAAPPAIDPRS